MNDYLPIKLVKTSPDAVIPSQGRIGDAGYDLTSLEHIILQPFKRKLISTGISIELPEGYAALVVPRSGNAINKGLSLVNTPGLIDSNFRGEIKAIAINLDPNEAITIEPGDRIAQLVIIKVENVKFELSDSLSETNRGSGGFGSSGS